MTPAAARDQLAHDEALCLAQLLTADDNGAIVIVVHNDGVEATLNSCSSPRLATTALDAFVKLLGDERDRLAGVLARNPAHG